MLSDNDIWLWIFYSTSAPLKKHNLITYKKFLICYIYFEKNLFFSLINSVRFLRSFIALNSTPEFHWDRTRKLSKAETWNSFGQTGPCSNRSRILADAKPVSCIDTYTAALHQRFAMRGSHLPLRVLIWPPRSSSTRTPSSCVQRVKNQERRGGDTAARQIDKINKERKYW